MTEGHQAGLGGEGSVEALQDIGGVLGGTEAAGVDLKVKAPLKFLYRGHHTGMFTVRNEKMIPPLPEHRSEGNVAAVGNIFRQGQGTGIHP
jgi:hypothetical protein